jgi:hypothetical protein
LGNNKKPITKNIEKTIGSKLSTLRSLLLNGCYFRTIDSVNLNKFVIIFRIMVLAIRSEDLLLYKRNQIRYLGRTSSGCQ